VFISGGRIYFGYQNKILLQTACSTYEVSIGYTTKNRELRKCCILGLGSKNSFQEAIDALQHESSIGHIMRNRRLWVEIRHNPSVDRARPVH
jgi:hypothetical protein